MKTSFPRFLLIVVVALLSISVSIIIRRGTFFEIDLVEGYSSELGSSWRFLFLLAIIREMDIQLLFLIFEN